MTEPTLKFIETRAVARGTLILDSHAATAHVHPQDAISMQCVGNPFRELAWQFGYLLAEVGRSFDQLERRLMREDAGRMRP